MHVALVEDDTFSKGLFALIPLTDNSHKSHLTKCCLDCNMDSLFNYGKVVTNDIGHVVTIQAI